MSVKSPVPNWLELHLPVCEAIVALFAPLAEVAVHDIRRDRIVGIWNPISGRKVGDRPLIDELPPYSEDARVIGPYPKVLADGRAITSVSVVLHNAKGAPRGLLCINFDRSPLDGTIDLLVRFAAAVEDRPPELFDRDWREQILLVVDEECRSRSLRRDRLTRDQRLDLVRVLDERGLFATRNAAAHAGRALGVSRTTVYALLKEARS
jgi:D-arginine utilization repressor